MMTVKINCSVGLLLLLLCMSCSRQTSVEDIIYNAESIIEQQPDSALTLLYSVLDINRLDESQYYKYHLLFMQAKDKTYQDITADTIIFSIKDYYLRKKDYQNAASAAFYCGRVLHEGQDVQKAADAYLEAGKYADLAGIIHLKGLALGNLSVLYCINLLTEESIAKGKEAIALLQKTRDYPNEINSWLTIGFSFFLEQKNDSAVFYCSKGLQLADSIKHMQASARINMSIAYRQMEKFGKAKELLQEALSFKSNDTEKVKIYMNLADICVDENHLDSARYYLDKSFTQTGDSLLQGFIYENYSRLEAQEGNCEKALQYFIKYNEYHETIIEKNRNQALLELQRKYDFKSLQIEKDKLVIEKQKIIIVSLFILFTAFLVIFLSYRKLKQKERLILEIEQKIESLKGMANKFSDNNDSFGNILLHHFSILRKVALIENEINADDRKKSKDLIKKINMIVYEQDMLDWDKLYETMNKLQNGLYEKIREQYTQLNDNEFRICCLSCENFSSEEMATILNMNVNKIHKQKSGIRKKTGMQAYAYYTNIKDYFLANLITQH